MNTKDRVYRFEQRRTGYQSYAVPCMISRNVYGNEVVKELTPNTYGRFVACANSGKYRVRVEDNNDVVSWSMTRK